MWRRVWVCSQPQPLPIQYLAIMLWRHLWSHSNHSFTTSMGGEARNPTPAYSCMGLIPNPEQGGRIFQIHPGGRQNPFLDQYLFSLAFHTDGLLKERKEKEKNPHTFKS